MKPRALLIAALVAATAGGAAADELRLSLTRTGIVDDQWQRAAAGLAEHAFAPPRDHSARGIGLRYRVPLGARFGAALEVGTMGDDATANDLDAAWSAVGLGLFGDARWTHERTGLYAGLAVGPRVLFSELQFGALDERWRRPANGVLVELRPQLGWDSGARWPKVPLVTSLEFGASNVYGFDYGDAGTLDVGLWNAALTIGVRLPGLDRWTAPAAAPAPAAASATAPPPAPTPITAPAATTEPATP